MALPVDFPQPPKPPPAIPPSSEPFGSKAWVDRIRDLQRALEEQAKFNAALRAHLDSLPQEAGL